nr:hypothetical protein [Burkholderia ambifaria]
MQQPVPTRQIEQPVAKVRQYRTAARRRARRPGQRALDVHAERLLAPGAQAHRECCHVGRAVMTVHFRHFDDRRRDDRMQPFVKHEQIASMFDERAQVAFGFEVQPACEAGQHHPQHEHVGDLVVMADGSLPARVPGQINGTLDRRRRVKLQCEIGLAVMAVGRVIQLQRADDVQARCGVRLHAMHRADIHLRRFAVRASQRQPAPFADHDAVRVERRHLAVRVQFRNLPE